jgi:hypothetical protein
MEEENVSTTLPKDAVVKKKKIEPTTSLYSRLNDIYDRLKVPVPEQYLERYTDGGMEFTGYKAQYAINLLNEVIGLGKWYVTFKLEKIENINKAWLSYGFVTIVLRLNDGDMEIANGVGGSYAKDIANSLKGTKTSAFKNACRYLGIGNELYLAGHEEDIVYEDIVETIEPVVEDNNDNEFKKIKEKIEAAKDIPQLDIIVAEINTVAGKAVKDLLIKIYNAKRITLLEKNGA